MDVGGRLIEQADAEYLIRGRGYVKSRADLENIVVGADMRGTPIYVKNLGTVQTGGAIRRGLLEMNGEGEAVGASWSCATAKTPRMSSTGSR